MQLYIAQYLSEELAAYVKAATGEISFLGRVIIDTEGDPVLEDFALLEQEASSSSVHLPLDAVEKFLLEREEDGLTWR